MLEIGVQLSSPLFLVGEDDATTGEIPYYASAVGADGQCGCFFVAQASSRGAVRHGLRLHLGRRMVL